MFVINFGLLALLGTIVVLVGVAITCYLNWRIGVIALTMLALIAGIGGFIILRERQNNPIEFAPTAFDFKWDSQHGDNANWKLDEKIDCDDAHFTLHCPVGHTGVSPEFDVEISDKTSFPVTKHSLLNFYLLLDWNDNKLSPLLGRKPTLSLVPLSGYLEWDSQLEQPAPNILVLKVHLNYFPDERKVIVANKTITVTVQVERE